MKSTSEAVTEGYEYKRGLIKLLQSGKISLNDIAKITISDEEDSNDGFDEKESGTSPTKNDVITADAQSNKNEVMEFQNNFAEAQNCLEQIPSLIAQLNTELGMVTNRTVVRTLPNDDNLDAFIWKFNITFQWKDEQHPLPIQNARNIQDLNDALNDEATYQHVVSDNC